MNVAWTTSAGTDVYEPTEAEFDVFLEKEAAQLGLSVKEFKRTLAKGELDAPGAEVSYLVALVNASGGD